MKRIVKNIEKLQQASEPIKFISNDLNETKEAEEEARAIIEEITQIMQKHTEIPALSAPQIGELKRIFCIRFNDGIKTFINPVITRKIGSSLSPETFSSMPGKEILIARPEEITAVYYTDKFKYEDNKMMGFAARVFDQQCQLLDGVTPDELGLVSDIETEGKFEDLSEDELKEVFEIYKKFIQVKTQKMEESIKSDENMENIYRNLKFTESVVNGKTTVYDEEGAKMQKITKNAETAQKNYKQKKEFKSFVTECLARGKR